ncbi:transferase [Salmonella enterica subsp. enterica]|uniref:Transferase n=1 Tax=Salmonella enterica I TaxID=59201 RepID=A0A3S4HVE3_SALET|nr:transferase [Salmonella enterica subsp. enterica]
MLHGCTIGNRVLVGMGSIVLDGAIIEDDVMIGAGSLVPQHKTAGKRLFISWQSGKTDPPLERC